MGGTHRTVLQAVAHRWPTEPEIRELWLTITQRFADTGAGKIKHERAGGIVTTDVPSKHRGRTVLGDRTDRSSMSLGSGLIGNCQMRSLRSNRTSHCVMAPCTVTRAPGPGQKSRHRASRRLNREEALAVV
ncbi:hypothetical protein [Gordonia bronchialis]|uniref:hypothetical protein n=1 Tax=Gordonia bronchialis TaxID=2054 RepID=UPI0037C0C04C